MLDIQFIRDNPALVKEKSKQKGYKPDIDKLLEVDVKRRNLQMEIEELRQKRNVLAATLKKGKPSKEQLVLGKKIKDDLSALERDFTQLEIEYELLLGGVPNMPLANVPVGLNEDDNKVSKKWGEPINFTFKPKSHAEIGEDKDLIDKERAAKVAGTRFTYLKGDLVMLEIALWQFALDKLTDERFIEKLISDNNLDLVAKPFVPVLPPAVAKTAVYEATGRLNKEEQTYKLAEDDLWLNASAEHVMAPMYLGEILDEIVLPIRYVGLTTAFRREAGTYGKDTEGILRLHQFNKLEMETFSTPETSLAEHHLQIAIQEYFMQELDLPYQVVTKCTAEIGFPNASGVDIEVWLPSQAKYRETHTADYITDFQARSMQTRLRRSDGKLEFIHTNDATAFSERPLIAIIENFQTKDGHIIIPRVLRPYLGDREQI